jgi:hypothetical protein
MAHENFAKRDLLNTCMYQNAYFFDFYLFAYWREEKTKEKFAAEMMFFRAIMQPYYKDKHVFCNVVILHVK